MKGARRKLYNIALNRNQVYEIVSLVDDNLSEIIMTQVEKQQEYKEMGKEKAYYKQYYLTHKEKYKKQQKEYYEKNKDRRAEYQKEWRKKNKKKLEEYIDKRRKKKLEEKKKNGIKSSKANR